MFYSRPLLRVKKAGVSYYDPDKKVNFEDNLSNFDRTCLILASKGFCAGNPENIANCRVDWVLKMIDFHRFTTDFNEELTFLNNEYR